MKDTFKRLPIQKQESVLNAFFKEFIDNDFETASLSKVVAQLGIAKGSVYQYFGNKKAVYTCLSTLSGDKKMEYIQGIDRAQFDDFWDWYRELFAAGIQFDLQCPLESQFLYRSSQDRSNQALTEILTQNNKNALSYFAEMVQKEQENGQISKTWKADFIALTVINQSLGIQKYLEEHLKLDLNKNIRESNTVFAKEHKQIFAYVDDSIRMFRASFSSKTL